MRSLQSLPFSSFWLFVQLLSSASGLAGKPIPIKHVVMFNLKPEATAAQQEQIQNGLLELPRKIPQIWEYQLGLDLRLEAGQKHPAGKNRSIHWSATFDSQEDYEAYDSSDAHREFLALLKPLLEPGTRAAIQFDISNTIVEYY